MTKREAAGEQHAGKGLSRSQRALRRLAFGRYGAPPHERLYYRLRLHRWRGARERSRVLGLREYSRLSAKMIANRPAIHVRPRGRPRGYWVRPEDSDLDVLVQVFDRGEVTPPIDADVCTILDAGANVGITADYLLTHFPDARLVAIEPDADNCDLFRRNVVHAGVTLLQAGLWDRDQPLRIVNPDRKSWAFRTECGGAADEGENRVDGITLDTALAAIDADHFDLIKIDIEGAEAKLFVTRWRAVFEQATMIFVEAHDAATARHIDGYLHSLGFTVARQGDMTVAYREPSR